MKLTPNGKPLPDHYSHSQEEFRQQQGICNKKLRHQPIRFKGGDVDISCALKCTGVDYFMEEEYEGFFKGTARSFGQRGRRPPLRPHSLAHTIQVGRRMVAPQPTVSRRCSKSKGGSNPRRCSFRQCRPSRNSKTRGCRQSRRHRCPAQRPRRQR